MSVFATCWNFRARQAYKANKKASSSTALNAPTTRELPAPPGHRQPPLKSTNRTNLGVSVNNTRVTPARTQSVMAINGNPPTMVNNGNGQVSNGYYEVSQSEPSLPAAMGGVERKELEALKTEVHLLRRELVQCRETIGMLKEREKAMRDRLSEQAQKQLAKSSKFEDISLGDNRPTVLIRRYGNLYSQSRVDALDALDALPEMQEFDDLKGKLLFSVVVLAFRSVQQSVHSIESKLRRLLQLPKPEERSQLASIQGLVGELEDTVSVYLRKTVDRYDLSSNVQEVCNQVWNTLYDYPSLKECAGLKQYIEECVRISWGLSVQNPRYVVDYDCKAYKPDLHTRFHTSNPESKTIKSVLWPALREGENGPCVQRGVVLT